MSKMAKSSRPNRAKTKSTSKKAVVKNSSPKKPELRPRATLASSFSITKNSVAVLWHNKSLFGGIMLVYGIAYIVLVQGLSGTANASTIKGDFSGFFHGNVGGLFSGLLVIGSTNTNGNPSASTYQAFLILIISLVVIWTLRQVYSGAIVRVRDGYYKGLYPLIPFVLIALVIGVELIPAAVGATAYSVFVTQGIAITVAEKAIGVILLAGLVLFSMYFISSSIFGLYIVTLPDMTPIKALRSAKALVKGRRLIVMRKVIYLPVMLIIAISIIMLPFIVLVPVLAVWIFFILSLVAITVVHGYLYNLYRELIK